MRRERKHTCMRRVTVFLQLVTLIIIFHLFYKYLLNIGQIHPFLGYLSLPEFYDANNYVIFKKIYVIPFCKKSQGEDDITPKIVG